MLAVNYPANVDYSPLERAQEILLEKAKNRYQYMKDIGTSIKTTANGIASQINNYQQQQKMDDVNKKQDALMRAYYENILNDPNSTASEKAYATNILNSYYTTETPDTDSDSDSED